MLKEVITEKNEHRIAEKCHIMGQIMFPGTLAYIQNSCRIQTSAFALGRQPRECISENANSTQY